MTVKIKLDKGAFLPERAHKTDAGADLRSIETVTVPAHSWKNIHTGVHIELPKGYFGLLQSKSGLNTKHGITCRGVVDEGYSGEIICAMQNISDVDYTFSAGDKLTQIILLPVLYADFEQFEEIAAGDRGNNGYGSSGK